MGSCSAGPWASSACAWHHRQPARRRRRPATATARPCSSATAAAPSPACSPTASASWAAPDLPALRRRAPPEFLGFGFGGTLLACSCGSAAASLPRPPMAGRRRSARSRRTSPGRSAQCRHHRRQRGRQRERLRRHSRRHLRELRGHHRRRVILGAFGHKGVIFPLLVRGIGVSRLDHLHLHRQAGPDTSDTALSCTAAGSAPSSRWWASSCSASAT